MEDCGCDTKREAAPGPLAWKDLGAGGPLSVPETRAAPRWHPRGHAERSAEQELLEGLALTSQYFSPFVLDEAVKGSQISEMPASETTRAEEVAMATKNDETVGDREAVNTTATTTTSAGSEEPKTAAGKSGKKKNKKKKSAKKSTLPADGDAAAAKPEGAAKKPTAGTGETWALIWKLLESSREMVNDKANHEHFKTMLGRAIALTAPAAPKGPLCANPSCGEFGHTLAVCPVPTDPEYGDMTGCFFCNVVNHDADDCPMMEWVSPATLVTHLITNRAGMPPWNTRIDWVALAISEWDLVCFTMLPLTRAFVKKVYIPGQLWKEVNGVSPITDPLFKNANRKLLKDLARNPKPGDARPRRRLMESSKDMCYNRGKCDEGIEHVVFKNEALQAFIPDMSVDEETYRRIMAAYEREMAELAETQNQLGKKMPKKVTKERKGRRAMKKEAMAAAAAEEDAVAGPSEPKNNPANNNDQVERDEPSEDEKDIPVSETLLNLTDAVDELVQNIQKITKS